MSDPSWLKHSDWENLGADDRVIDDFEWGQAEWMTEAEVLLRSLTHSIASQSVNFEIALERVLRQVCELTDWDLGEAWIPVLDGTLLRCSPIWYGSDRQGFQEFRQVSEALVFAPGVGLPGRVWSQAQPEWLSDVSKVPEALFLRLEVLLRTGLKAVLGVPILAGAKVLAVLVFFRCEVRQEDRRLVELVAAIAARLGTLLQLQQTEVVLDNRQRRLSVLIDSLPGIVFTGAAEPDWRMTYMSEGCYHLTGYPASTFVGPDRPLSYNDIVHSDDVSRVMESIAAAIAQQKPYVVEYRIRTRSGTERWLWEKGYGVFDQNGEVSGVEGFITDITSLKLSEHALRQSEARFRAIFASAAVGINAIDRTGRLLEMNPLLQGMLGYEGEEWRSLNFADFTHPDDLPGELQLHQEMLEERRDSYQIEKRYIRKSGEIFWVRVTASAIRLPGSSLFNLGIVEDITERKQAEAAIHHKEAFLRLILDNIPQSLFWKDKNLVYQGGNQVFVQTAGLSSVEEVAGKTDDDLWGAELAEKFRRRDRLVMESGIAQLHILDCSMSPDGQEIWKDISEVPIHDAEGQVIGVLGTYEDVSDRRRAETALEQREQYLAVLVQMQQHLLALQPDEDPYAGILEQLGPISAASRVYVFENHRDSSGRLLTSQKAEWCASGTLPATYNLVHNIPIEEVCPRWVLTLSQHQPIVGHVADFPASERNILDPQGILSILVLPLMVHGTFFGFIRFDHCKWAKTWNSSEIDLLRAAAAALSLSLERQQAEAKYRSIFENAVEGIFQSTPDGRYTIANSMLARLYGYDSPTELRSHLTDIERQLYVDPQRRHKFTRLMQEQGSVLGFESEVYRRDGTTIWISESARAIHDDRGNLVGYEGTVEDITQRKRTEAELLKRDNLLQGVAAATNCLLMNPCLEAAIPQALAILGEATQVDRTYLCRNDAHPSTGEVCTSMDYEWMRDSTVFPPRQPHWQQQSYLQAGLERWYQDFLAGRSVSGNRQQLPAQEQELLQHNGIVSIIMMPIFVEETLWGYIGFDDCQQERLWVASEESILVAVAASLGGAIKRQQTEDQMRYQAFHDILTGLPNRMMYDCRLDQALAHAHRSGEMLAVLFLDLDRFKTINDSLGHAIGDQLLQQATQRMVRCLRQEDTLARWGGDEFTLLLPNLHGPEDAAKVAQRIAVALKPSFLLEQHELHISCSIGIALYPHDGTDAATLLKNADAALYRVKEQGRNSFQFYTAAINSQASERLNLDSSLYRALERQEFTLYYQPQIDTTTGQITQMEALLRWQHPELGLVPPLTFISLAEENGMILPIGEWVLRTACAQNYHWHSLGFPQLRVAVNLSARQFRQPCLVDRIAQILEQTGLPPEYLNLEITETAAMENVDFTTEMLHDLRAMGVRISMDDFGMGYSSLNYLKRFPLHALKIDRSFVQDLTRDGDDVAIVSTIITLAHGLNLEAVAEGVETPQQREKLRSLHCEEMQGYLFSAPLSVEAATTFLLKNRVVGHSQET